VLSVQPFFFNVINCTGHWTKMHQSLVKFSESEASNHTPSLADFTTTTPELKFSVHTPRIAPRPDLTGARGTSARAAISLYLVTTTAAIRLAAAPQDHRGAPLMRPRGGRVND
jgi:hypothetical protein